MAYHEANNYAEKFENMYNMENQMEKFKEQRSKKLVKID
jgi:hypothetical protein